MSNERKETAAPYARRCRGWCFTNHQLVDEITELGDKLGYVIWQLECCPTTKKIHQQGYVEFLSPVGLAGCKKLLPAAHWTVARGSGAQNKEYCSKSESRAEPHKAVELGELMKQGKRTDLSDLADLVVETAKAHGSFAQVALSQPEKYIRYHKGMEKLDALVRRQQRVRNPPRVLWLGGQSQVGKSWFVRDLLNHSNTPYWIKPQKKDWWDGYGNEKVVWFDDFTEGTVDYGTMLQVLDQDVIQVEVKGSYVPLTSWIFIFTTNKTPQACYPREFSVNALTNRLRKEGCVWVEEFHRLDLCPVAAVDTEFSSCSQCQEIFQWCVVNIL